MSKEIDWEELATALGLVIKDGEQGSSEAAKRALELLIGEEALRASVDYYIAGRRGAELARSVLWQLHPWSAMKYCYEIFNGQRSLEDRRMAVELVRVVADHRALSWVAEFLDDEDSHIQVWGVGVLDQLLWSHLIEPEAAEDLLRMAERHQNEAVRERVEFIRSFLSARTGSDKQEPQRHPDET
jgi:hypothetical protein